MDSSIYRYREYIRLLEYPTQLRIRFIYSIFYLINKSLRLNKVF